MFFTMRYRGSCESSHQSSGFNAWESPTTWESRYQAILDETAAPLASIPCRCCSKALFKEHMMKRKIERYRQI